jgi:two-component system chemotaxis sensor kinase CheA
VHAEYSAYLEAIFETKDIAGRKLMDLVFSDTDLGADVLSQVDAASHACLGEDSINFAFNQHLLVGEIARRMPDGRVKILDLSWSAITNESDVIVRLMLCVRDVTELRQLAAEAAEQKRRLEMIGEILAVSQEKFHQFIESSSDFISENERIIRKHSQADGAAIAELSRNMHTIKGNARTYNLQHLTNVVHETEQSYAELRQPESERAWNQEGLVLELARVKEALESYATINEVSLGRKGVVRRADVERYLMIDIEHIQDSLRQLEAANPDNLGELISMRDSVRRTLQLLGTESVSEALSGVLGSLPSLANELGKEAPLVRVQDNGYRVHSHAGETLKNVFMHLLRNSIDHGIEPAEHRVARGQAPAGVIDIEVGVDAAALQITLSDDGRGLALGRIRSIATEKGWIGADDTVSDEEVANLIFRPGFSTAEKVTEVSGRGVGMDAVRDFLKRENGSLQLRFTDAREGAAFRRFQTVVCLPGTLAIASAGQQHAGTNAEEAGLDTMVE